MKSKIVLLSAIFAIFSLSARAQITEMLSQGFESSETQNYSLTPSGAQSYSTTLYAGGSRSIKLVQKTDSDVELILDTLDFTSNTALRYISLYFDHIALLPKDGSNYELATIHYKRANQTDDQWVAMSGQEYDAAGQASGFSTTGAFNENSYSAWRNYSAISNTMWRSERFNLDNVITPQVATNERKLIIKFVLAQRESSGSFDTNSIAWWIDNIRIDASAERMVTPTITMRAYPYDSIYSNSRGARVVLSATTSLTSGINSDSVYVNYTVGSDPTVHMLPATPVASVANRYEAYIPFFGYDTLMRYYCVVRDSSGNENRATFPAAADSWIEYRYVRGVDRPYDPAPEWNSETNLSVFPFCNAADQRSEFYYDSALMAEAGYGIGALTGLRYIVGGDIATAQTRNRVQIKLRNVANTYIDTINKINFAFCKDMMTIVYDGPLTFPSCSAGDTITLPFMDTFYYAGNDLHVQVTVDGTTDQDAIPLKAMRNRYMRVSTYSLASGGVAIYNHNPIDGNASHFATTQRRSKYTPIFIFKEEANLPLLYDASITELVDPNYDVAMVDRPGSIKVKLKNQGAQPFQKVRISYTIDDTIQGYYDWNQNINAGVEETVTIADDINIPAGFHTLRVWVEDSVTTNAGLTFRDHEPYNDTMFSEFIVCDGPMGGVRNIGGDSPHFNTIDEFLFSLKRCGMNDSLIVRVAPGKYNAFTIPNISGLTDEHYLVFESMESEHAIVYSDSNNTQNSTVNLENVADVRFRNMDFVRINGPLTYMVKTGQNSSRLYFTGCHFIDSISNPPTALRIESMLSNSYAEHLYVDSCTFVGARIGCDIKGRSIVDYSSDVAIRHSTFRNQAENAIKVEYMIDVVIDDNEMYDVYSNSYYVLQLNSSEGNVSVQRNRIYTTNGAGALAVSGIEGTEEKHALIANNMMEGKDNGTAGMMRSVMNIIQASYTDVVYNSVKMTAPMRANVPAVVMGGSTITHNRFLNNIVATMDNTNYAFSYNPGTDTTNQVGYNVYYSMGNVLNRKGTVNCTSLDSWLLEMPADTFSVSVNPVFLNSYQTDLRTFNRTIKGIGIPIAEVTDDIFGEERNSESPCPGAYEFSALHYDFEAIALLNPQLDNCDMPEQVELVMSVTNSGVDNFKADSNSTLTFFWQVDNGPVNSIAVSQDINSEDTVAINTGYYAQLPPNGYLDKNYKISFWTTYADDPNRSNDTARFNVISRYHPAAPSDRIDSVEFAEIDTITLTEGVDSWSVYNSALAPQRQSNVYWYTDSTTDEYFHQGTTYITDEVRSSQVYYVRQRREAPIVRFTQVELSHASTSAGVTFPMPTWMIDSRKMAVQLTNVGDATAYLEGDTLMLVSPTANLNNKVYVFGNVKIEPGQSLVMQYVSAAMTDSSVTLRTDIAPNIAYNSKMAFVYRHNGVVEDAVPFNGASTTSTTQSVSWNSMNVPSWVWSGSDVSMSSNTAGVVRVAFDGKASDWQLSSTVSPMNLSSTDSTWIRYRDMGCPGDVARVEVAPRYIPLVEVSIDEVIVPESECALGEEEISVRLSNYGIDTARNIEIHYSVGVGTVTDTVQNVILPSGEVVHTFSQTVNMHFDKDSTVEVKVWITAIEEDHIRSNDSSVVSIFSSYTPDAPDAVATRSVNYGTSDTISIPCPDGLIPVWYDYDLNAIDTGYTHVSELLYTEGSRGVAYLANNHVEGVIGTEENINAYNTFPSPFQSTSKYVKQQYIYSVAELRASGLNQGVVDSISFYLDSIYGSATSIKLPNYKVSLALIDDTVFASRSDWRSATHEVLSLDTLRLYKEEEKSWKALKFSSPFVWDGASSVLVQVSYELSTAIASGVSTRYSTKTATVVYKNNATALTPSTEEFVGIGTLSAARPNIRFSQTIYGCTGPITNYDVQLLNIPQVDASLLWQDGFDTMIYSSCDPVEIKVKLASLGLGSITGGKLQYILDGIEDSISLTTSYASGTVTDVTLFSQSIMPGIHTLKVIAAVDDDNIASNDTIDATFIVRFCEGEYIIAADSTGDYTSFGEAIEKLDEVGILGAVVFKVKSGNYLEQVVIDDIYGLSSTNTITFEGEDTTSVLTGIPTATDNYVLHVAGASHIRLSNFTIRSRKSANNSNYANALLLEEAEDVRIDGCHIVVDGSVAHTNAMALKIVGKQKNLVISNNQIDSGYCAISAATSGIWHSNVRITGNTINNFANLGILFRSVSSLTVKGNKIISSNSTDSRSLTGVYLSETKDSLYVEKNVITLVDNRKSGKRGLQLENIVASNMLNAYVVNNMISTNGTDVKNLTPAKSAGIWVDSISSYVNFFYNTVRVYSTTSTAASASELSYAFHCGTMPDHLQIINNIFYNASYGSAYHVMGSANVLTSNFNGYYSQALYPFTWDGTSLTSLEALQSADNDDGNSLFIEPHFVSNEDLHLITTHFSDKAQYNGDFTEDIDGNIRSQIPAPTLGAHEVIRPDHDVALINIIEPKMPVSVTSPLNIETDSIRVIITLTNNGIQTETGVTWYAYVEGYEAEAKSATKSLGTFFGGETRLDTVMIPAFIGLVDTHEVRVVVMLNNDSDTSNNEQSVQFYIRPAFNLAAKMVRYSGGCGLTEVPINMQIKNEGQKAVPAGVTIKVGYGAEIVQPTGISISSIPTKVEQNITLTSPLAVGDTMNVAFTQLANLYPTGNSVDIKVRVRGWVKYTYDLQVENDTTPNTNTASPIRDSKYLPADPVANHVTLSYGTWGELTASQANELAIRWYRDTNAAPFYSPSSYIASTTWSSTPQYFSDSTYYLQVTTAGGCKSNFVPLYVTVSSLLQRDVALEEVYSPLGSRVYLENDTVRVRIANYGSNSINNIPVCYQVKRGNQVIQNVTETITSTIASHATYDYTFNTLAALQTPSTAQAYTLIAYTNLANDGARRNDTIRNPYQFASLSEERYSNFEWKPQTSETRFDITRVSFNGIDVELPLLDRDYTDMALYSDPLYPVLHVTRGTTDSILLELTPINKDELHFRCRANVNIDFNRDGYFGYDSTASCNEWLVRDAVFYNDSLLSAEIAIPACASLGYQRMRVAVSTNDDNSTEGHVIDFLLFVDEEPANIDLAFSQIVSPRNFRADGDLNEVTFRMDNRGKTTITTANITFKIAYEDSTSLTTTFPWTGNLLPGHSTVVALDNDGFPITIKDGVNKLTIWHETPGDEDSTNNVLMMEYYKFRVITLTLEDNFDDKNYWYAPQGVSEFSRNFWQRGKPQKTYIKGTYSGNYSWATDLKSSVRSGKRGNVSYLYSPIIDLSQIRSDTLRFRMIRNLSNYSSLHIEYYNYNGKWVKLDDPSSSDWYNNGETRVFDGSSPVSDGYRQYTLSTESLKSNFNGNLQLRFVYTTPVGTSSTADFGDGCAVDNFYLGRARQPIDAGVVNIIYPVSPTYGQTINPKVIVKNFGTDTLTDFQMGYTHYGASLPKMTNITCHVAPGASEVFTFDHPFVVTEDYPDSFYITAFTLNSRDIFKDNDSITQLFHLTPLAIDINGEELIAPLPKVVAGDTTVRVTIRIRNFGLNEVSHATAGYTLNGQDKVVEDVDFEALLGRPLASMEYYNYTFEHKLLAPMGAMVMTAWMHADGDMYEYNDTVEKRVDGIMSVTDLAASSIILEENNGVYHVTVEVENRGSRACNNFRIAFWYDDDPTTMLDETYSRALPLAALSKDYFRFDYDLQNRSKPYDNITAMVYINDDNDRSNDTTKLIVPSTIDLEAVKVLVEENAAEDCRVMLQIRNVGNTPTTIKQNVSYSAVVNGTQLITNVARELIPGHLYHIEFPQRVPKSTSRTYVGTGTVGNISSDTNMVNNQTSIVEVVNYIESIDRVAEISFSLGQNQPNPFASRTVIPFTLRESAMVRFFVVDAVGHPIHSETQRYAGGDHTISLDMASYPAGVYFYGIEVNGSCQMRKMILK